MNVDIKKLSPDLLNKFLYFFDNVAFTDNPSWADCYCHFHHFQGSREEWAKSSAKHNRKASSELIASGKMNGFLAFLDDKPIGWINIDNKRNYNYLPFKFEDKSLKDTKIASIVCFVIAHQYRRQGLARKLLQEAIKALKEEGFTLFEAYPRKNVTSDAHHYHGPFLLYESEGFSISTENEKFYIMRKIV
jgi:ribosomal protein S18 acetylase RimI-like enzyme